MIRIRYYRNMRGLTMKELGNIVGCTEGAISNYELGKREPSYEMLLKISEALGTDVSHLLGTAPDDDMVEYLEDLRSRPELRLLLKVSRGVSKENIESVAKMIENFSK